ncbi:MAG: NapC/NirT family cytochrome c [Firmicutes bacterium]|nr:NapC/NirT family cytochrome c [Bacillota bacterium]
MQLPNLKDMDPKKKRLLLYQLGALVVLIIAGLFLGNSIAARYQTCATCHEMGEAIKSWQGSSHEKIGCPNCHNPAPGIKGFILGIPHKIESVVAHVSGNYTEPIKAKTHIKTEVCQNCHVSWRDVSPSGDLIIPHQKHLDKGIPCVKCHFAVVHGANLEGKFIRRPAMELCLSCHGGGNKNVSETFNAPVLTCKNCHTEKAIPESHKDAKWFEIHSLVAKDPSHEDSNCKRCHGWTPFFCSQCHQSKRPSTHYGGTEWRTYHSIRARVNYNGCLVCHNKETFCFRCHDEGTFSEKK